MKTLMKHNLANANFTLKRGECVRWISVLDRGWRTRKRITVTLSAVGAHFEWFIFVLGRGDNVFPMDVRIVHKGAKTKSRIIGRCVLMDSSRISFIVAAIVQKQAKGADTHLAFRTLLFSPHTHVHTVPSLEIATDDVSASHAASVDRLSDEALFYCASRGLEVSDAAQLLVHAFFSADEHELGDSATAEFVIKKLERIWSAKQ